VQLDTAEEETTVAHRDHQVAPAMEAQAEEAIDKPEDKCENSKELKRD
jgi:hypothetical protein